MKTTRGILHRWCAASRPGAGSKDGFSLAETMIAVALWSLITASVVTVFIALHRSYYVGSSYINIHKEARTGMDWMAGDMRWGRQFLSSYGAYTKSNSCVIIEIPSISPTTGDIIMSKYDHVIYTISGDALKRIVYADAASRRKDETRTVSQDVSALLFQQNVNNLDITLTTRKTVASLNLSNTVKTNIRLRNL